MARTETEKETDIDLTPFMNILVTIIPVLLSTAVFSKMAVIQLNLPSLAGAGAAQSAADEKNITIEVEVHPDGLVVTDGKKVNASYPNEPGQTNEKGESIPGYQFGELNKYLRAVKGNYPDKRDATILYDPYTEYSYVIDAMDAVAIYREGEGVDVEIEDLFPNISIGDTPLGKRR